MSHTTDSSCFGPGPEFDTVCDGPECNWDDWTDGRQLCHVCGGDAPPDLREYDHKGRDMGRVCPEHYGGEICEDCYEAPAGDLVWDLEEERALLCGECWDHRLGRCGCDECVRGTMQEVADMVDRGVRGAEPASLLSLLAARVAR